MGLGQWSFRVVCWCGQPCWHKIRQRGRRLWKGKEKGRKEKTWTFVLFHGCCCCLNYIFPKLSPIHQIHKLLYYFLTGWNRDPEMSFVHDLCFMGRQLKWHLSSACGGRRLIIVFTWPREQLRPDSGFLWSALKEENKARCCLDRGTWRQHDREQTLCSGIGPGRAVFFFFKKINHFGFFLKYFLLLFLNQLTK